MVQTMNFIIVKFPLLPTPIPCELQIFVYGFCFKDPVPPLM